MEREKGEMEETKKEKRKGKREKVDGRKRTRGLVVGREGWKPEGT